MLLRVIELCLLHIFQNSNNKRAKEQACAEILRFFWKLKKKSLQVIKKARK